MTHWNKSAFGWLIGTVKAMDDASLRCEATDLLQFYPSAFISSAILIDGFIKIKL